MSKKKIIGIVCAIVAVLAVVGVVVAVSNGKKSEENQTADAVESGHEGEMKSFLTGEWVDEKIGQNRPIAVMNGNTKEALPQYGLNSAGVIYEAPVEGGITRLMAIYEDYKDLTQIGTVRSCRPYYAYFAKEFDAIYVHVGQSVHAESLLDSGVVDHLSGLDGAVNSTFYRTDEHPAPHNCYTSAEGIASGIATKGFTTTYPKSYQGHYQFADEDELNTLKDGEDSVLIKPYYFYNKPSFVYDEKTKTYKRFQFGEEHIDVVDGKQVEVSNIIFQNVSSSEYEGTQYLNLGIDGSGEGKFFTNGKMIDVTWKKESDGITHYYDLKGKEITLNPGKTWVCIIEKQHAEKNTFDSKEEK
ncbi:MAG: DUF3048 domain-containing protein [Lachnospiraceae bacterium]|nr:DUF3048 domain-containing protein [Lachnospiraceae bacterium]